MTAVMRDAEARRHASAITRSSIRFSLVGGQVGWMMKVSRPRMFSRISTLISPSLKRPTWAFASGTRSTRAMSCASSGCALPEKTAIVAGSMAHLTPENCTGTDMAGVAGFDPANDGIKARCLTTWLHPTHASAGWRERPSSQLLARQGRHPGASAPRDRDCAGSVVERPVVDDQPDARVVIHGGHAPRQELPRILPV